MARELTGRARRRLYNETVAGPVTPDEGVDEVDHRSLQPTPVRRPPTLVPSAPVRPPRPTLRKPLRPVTAIRVAYDDDDDDDADDDDDESAMEPSKVSIMNN